MNRRTPRLKAVRALQARGYRKMAELPGKVLKYRRRYWVCGCTVDRYAYVYTTGTTVVGSEIVRRGIYG